MKTLLFILLVMITACSNPVTNNVIAPSNGELIYSAPDSITVNKTLLTNGFNLSGYDTMTVTYDFRENTSDTSHTTGLAIYSKDSTNWMLANYWSLPFHKTNQYKCYVKEFNCTQTGKVYYTYLSFGNCPVVIKNLKIYRR